MEFLISHRIAGLFCTRIKKLELRLPPLKRHCIENTKTSQTSAVYEEIYPRTFIGVGRSRYTEYIFLKGSVLSTALGRDGELFSYEFKG